MELVETPVFTRQVDAALSDEAFLELQWALLVAPDAGVVIPGSGGLRKLRVALPGRGKRGGARLIYFWDKPQERLFLLFLYPKNERSDLTQAQLKVLRELVGDG
jgi:hypothetical protein